MNINSFFQNLIINPLQTIMNSKLEYVRYLILKIDVQNFNIEKPNDNGMSAITLGLSDNILVIYIGWEKGLLDANTYHIQTHLGSDIKVDDNLFDSERFTEISGSESGIWKGLINQKLIAVEVYGVKASPQILRLIFPENSVVIATGYSGDEILIGDGDDILILSTDEWQTIDKTLNTRWDLLWAN